MNNSLRSAITTIVDQFGGEDGQINNVKINFTNTGGTYITVQKTQRVFIPRASQND